MLWFKNRINCILLLSGNKGKGVFIPVFIPVLILVSILFAGCDKSKELNSFACEYKSYKCDGNSSYYCGYSGNDLIWKFSEKCTNGCNSSTGKCKSGNSASTSQDEKTRVGNCTGLPGNAEWNTVSSITQTWNGSSWEPPTTGSYNTTPSTKECRFRCKSFYSWTNSYGWALILFTMVVKIVLVTPHFTVNRADFVKMLFGKLRLQFREFKKCLFSHTISPSR